MSEAEGLAPDPERADAATAGEPSADDELERVEQAVEADLDRLLAERDEYLDALRRLQADFENYRKRVMRQQTEHVERAAERLVEKLLPVLDGFDLALAHDTEHVGPLHASLLGALEAEGLERLDPAGKPFDPNEHEAAVHEAGEGDGEAVVVEVLRPGYRFKGRLLRAAMVKVRG